MLDFQGVLQRYGQFLWVFILLLSQTILRFSKVCQMRLLNRERAGGQTFTKVRVTYKRCKQFLSFEDRDKWIKYKIKIHIPNFLFTVTLWPNSKHHRQSMPAPRVWPDKNSVWKTLSLRNIRTFVTAVFSQCLQRQFLCIMLLLENIIFFSFKNYSKS